MAISKTEFARATKPGGPPEEVRKNSHFWIIPVFAPPPPLTIDTGALHRATRMQTGTLNPSVHFAH